MSGRGMWCTLKGMTPQLCNLFEFADFRKFLKEYQEKRQAADRSYTRSRLCKDLGLPNTRSYFNDIIKGTKILSGNYVERFTQAFRMDEEESQYFRILVDFNQSTRSRERELLFDQLIALNRTPRKVLAPKEYVFYRHWHHTTVFTLMDVMNFSGDYKALARRLLPPITPAEARESIALLEKLGLIRKNEKGFWKATSKTLDSGPYAKDELVKQYQLQCLELAKKSLLMDLKNPRNFSTVTLSVSRNAGELIERKLQKFKAEARAIAHRETEPADRVYQLNIQFFPQSIPEEAV